jgi:hypothetical protein
MLQRAQAIGNAAELVGDTGFEPVTSTSGAVKNLPFSSFDN